MRLPFWLLHMLLLSVLVPPCCARTTTVRPSPTKLPAAVVFSREKDKQAQIVWRELDSTTEHVVLKLKSWGRVPDQFGYLPSPNGQWLLVWFMPDYPKAVRSRWVLIHLADGKIIKIGDTPEEPPFCLLPFWRDNRFLDLVGIKKTATYDLAKRKLLRPIPQDYRIPPGHEGYDSDKSNAYFLSYVHRYYPKEWAMWQASLAKLKKSRSFSYRYSSGEGEYLMIQSIGVPGLSEWENSFLHLTRFWPFPYLAVSPNGDYVASSRMYHYLITKLLDGTEVNMSAAGSLVQVLDNRTSKPVFEIDLPPRLITPPREVRPPKAMINSRRTPLPWVEAYITAIRWSRDGRYVSFDILNDGISKSATRIVDVSTKKQVLRLPGAFNAFVIPSPAATK